MAGVYQKEDILCSNVPKTPTEHKFKMVILCEEKSMTRHLCSSTCRNRITGTVSTESEDDHSAAVKSRVIISLLRWLKSFSVSYCLINLENQI